MLAFDSGFGFECDIRVDIFKAYTGRPFVVELGFGFLALRQVIDNNIVSE